MRKDAVAITVSSLVMGVFGAFLRWLMLRTTYDAETGLCARSAALYWIYVVYSFLALAAVLAFTLVWLRRTALPSTAAEALYASTPLQAVLGWVCFAAFAFCGVRMMFSAGDAGSRFLTALQRLRGVGMILGGAGLPFFTSRKEGEGNAMGRGASLLASVGFGVWLACTYLSNSQNPVRWSYAPLILAIVADTLVCYHVMCWYYGEPKPRAAVATLQLCVFLSLCVLPDSLGFPLTAALALFALYAMALLYGVISNCPAPGEKK
ncbi:MAG: hypothetical protein IJ705_06820 [Oscillospiraceae bacterium]|nr:hypothetical protein [Oscillospiraceae bacterium]